MIEEQLRLWRWTAIIGFFTGLVIFVSLAIETQLGINQQYFITAVTTGQAEAIFSPQTDSDYVLLGLMLVLITMLRLAMGIVVMVLLRESLMTPQQTILRQLHGLTVSGAIAAVVALVMFYAYVLLYSRDSDRYLFVTLIKLGNLMYSWMLQLSVWTLLLSLSRTRLIPVSIRVITAVLLVLAFVYSLVALHPDRTQFFSAFVTYIAGMVIAFYLALSASAVAGRLHPR